MRRLSIALMFWGLAAGSTPARATAPLVLPPHGSFDGEAYEDGFGTAVAIVGDLDGDGIDDFVVSADASNAGGTDAGQVYVFSGTAANVGLNAAPQVEALGSFTGGADSSYLGQVLAAAGDVDGDGLRDFLVGTPYDDQLGYNAGMAYLVLGRETGWAMYTSINQADASFLAEVEGDRVGEAVDGAGDVNGDGYDDILIGAPYNAEGGDNAGKAYLVLGHPAGWQDLDLADADASFPGAAESDVAGRGLAGVGDVDGDGIEDFVIGAPGCGNEGAAFLFLGDPAGWGANTPLTSAEAMIRGEWQGDGVGSALAGAGDVNGDGYDDILIGVEDYSLTGLHTGMAYLVLGRPSGWPSSLSNADASFEGEEDWAQAGYAVSSAGDMNGDGLDDILIGAPGTDFFDWTSGEAYVVLGRTTGWLLDMPLSSANASIVGTPEVEAVGSSVAGGGDLDGDGYDDILVGAPEEADGYPSGGLVSVLRGFAGADVDGDGTVGWIDDCHEGDVATYLGALEAADGVDQNCDGIVDDGTAAHDDDGDGLSENEGDCDDGDATIFPGAPEYCDGVDSNCDGTIPSSETTDADGDGWLECEDCDDTEPTTHPGATEFCDGIDSDCGWDLTATEVDDDGDGFAECDGDCDDMAPGVHPTAPEVCNGVDDDCDPETDENVDQDQDGWSSCDGDCDEGDDAVHPAAVEACDEVDNDCDGVVDVVDLDDDGWGGCDGDCDDEVPGTYPGADEVPYDGIDQDCDGEDLVDRDGDGHDGLVAGGGDCDDLDPDIHPDATEIPHDGIDQDCNGSDAIDLDGDGFEGGPDPMDCDDSDPEVHPGATEHCSDGADNDCDGLADDQDESCPSSEEDPAGGCACSAANEPGAAMPVLLFTSLLLLGLSRCRSPVHRFSGLGLGTVLVLAVLGCADEAAETPADPCEEVTGYYDGDGDGWGDPDVSRTACTLPTTYIENADDCDDTSATIHPQAPELCNEIDDDCDGDADEGLAESVYYADQDGDGYGDPATTSDMTCEQPPGFVPNDNDCDDTDPAVNIEPEIPCDGIDNDCDGLGDGVAAAALDGLEYATIQDAVGAASHGQKVSICPGTHVGRINVLPGQNIQLTSLSGDRSDTILDGDGTQTIVVATDSSAVTISHLTLQNGLGSQLAFTGKGGAILAVDSDLTLEDCLLVDNESATAGGGAVSFETTGSGGASRELTIDGCSFQSNTSGEPGGALLVDGEAVLLSIVDSSFADNEAIECGGSIHLDGDGDHTVTIASTSFTGNTSRAGGALGIAASGSNTLSIVDSVFEANTAPNGGGAIHQSSWGDIDLTITSSWFGANTAIQGFGGAICLDSWGDKIVWMEDSDLVDNIAQCGGALTLSGWGPCDVSILDTVLIGNHGTQTDSNGAIYLSSTLETATMDIAGGAVIQSPGGGLMSHSDLLVLTSDDVDWGADETDNFGYDICNDHVEYDHFTTGEVFTCTGDGSCS